MAVCGFLDKEPQINADERRYNPVTDFISFFVDSFFYVTDFSVTLCKEHKAQPQCGTRIGRIFTDNFNPCASASSAQSVFHHVCSSLKNPASETEVSVFICVHPRLINLKGPFQAPETVLKLPEGVRNHYE